MRKLEEYIFKLIIVGDPAVGKTALLMRYIENKFEEEYLSTIGVDFYLKTINMDNKEIKIQAWDTGGQEKFANIRPGYYTGAGGAIIVYDVTNPNSFSNLAKWITEVQKYCGNIPLLIAGNKVDLARSVDAMQAKTFADSNAIPIFESSAKDNVNVEAMFVYLCKFLISGECTVPTLPEVTATLSFEELSENYAKCSAYATQLINEGNYSKALAALEKAYIYSKAINFQGGINWAREQITFISRQLSQGQQPQSTTQPQSTVQLKPPSKLVSPDFRIKDSIKNEIKKIFSEVGGNAEKAMKNEELKPQLVRPTTIPKDFKEKQDNIKVPSEVFDILNSIRDKIVFGEEVNVLVNIIKKARATIPILYKEDHPILAEMDKIIETLASFRKIKKIDQVIKNLILEKVYEWEKRFQEG